MKLTAIYLILFSPAASSFVVAPRGSTSKNWLLVQPLAAAGAASKEEDLELTRKVIQDFMSDEPSTPEPKKEPEKKEKKEE